MKKIFKLTLIALFLSNFQILQVQSQTTDPKLVSDSEKGQIPTAMFLSDFHIGEVYGSVTKVLPKNDTKSKYISSKVNGRTIFYRKEVAELVNLLDQKLGAKEKIPYLILMGDIFDMAIHNESDVLDLAHTFFNEIQFTKNKRTFISYFDKIIYLPGNHDHHVWKMLQEEYYISDQLVKNFKALPLPQQSIGLLDLPSNKMLIKDPLIFPDNSNNFISSVLSQNTKEVYIAYPNLYIKYKEPDNSDGEETGICVTHGHFFEPGWNKSSLLFDNKNGKMNDTEYFRELEKNNSPLTEFSDFQVAQTSNALAQGISDLQFHTDPTFQKKYDILSKKYPLLFPIKMKKSNKPKDFDIITLLKYPGLVDKYLMHTQNQMKNLEEGDKKYSLNFKKLVYGHTHVPCFNVKYKKYISNSDETYMDLDLAVYNTGGWVNIKEVARPNPMFLYNDGSIKSVFKGPF